MALGIDAKAIPYVLRMADLSGAAKEDGTFDIEAIQTELNKVLDDIPVLKPQQTEKADGFRQIGASGGEDDSQQLDALTGGLATQNNFLKV